MAQAARYRLDVDVSVEQRRGCVAIERLGLRSFAVRQPALGVVPSDAGPSVPIRAPVIAVRSTGRANYFGGLGRWS